MGLLTKRTITRYKKDENGKDMLTPDGKKIPMWCIKSKDIQLVMDDKDARDGWADEKALIEAAGYARDTFETEAEAREFFNRPIKYSEIVELTESVRVGRGRPSAMKQADELNPEDAARAKQMIEKLKALGLRI